MKKGITIISASVALLAGVVAADAQGGYGPGVNPSNPQDLTLRSNPQDLTAPGGSNRQDLVRRPSGVSASPVTSTRAFARQPTAKAKAKQRRAARRR